MTGEPACPATDARLLRYHLVEGAVIAVGGGGLGRDSHPNTIWSHPSNGSRGVPSRRSPRWWAFCSLSAPWLREVVRPNRQF